MLEQVKKDYDKWLENLWSNYSIGEENDIETIVDIIEDKIKDLSNKMYFQNINDSNLQDELEEYLGNKIDDLNKNILDLKDLLFQLEELEENETEKESILQETIEIFTEQIS